MTAIDHHAKPLVSPKEANTALSIFQVDSSLDDSKAPGIKNEGLLRRYNL